ncbi:hypothetical protein [Meiothermus taiwanensis]|uniref:hypothetical protein n=1 Tax=Meiothermus taiwanensis TaxID=172827 RepID=UPI000A658058|nr:hypothetical protein [Meiothermus taiwanensis]
MKPIEVFAVVGAGGLAAFGLYTYARSRPKAEETVPGTRPRCPPTLAFRVSLGRNAPVCARCSPDTAQN